MLQHEKFDTLFRSYKFRFVIYLYATFFNIESISSYVRKILFGLLSQAC